MAMFVPIVRKANVSLEIRQIAEFRIHLSADHAMSVQTGGYDR